MLALLNEMFRSSPVSLADIYRGGDERGDLHIKRRLKHPPGKYFIHTDHSYPLSCLFMYYSFASWLFDYFQMKVSGLFTGAASEGCCSQVHK